MNGEIEELEVVPRKVRLLWEIDGQYKKFYWFQMENKDLYWGPSGEVSKNFASQQVKDTNSVTLSIPESISFNKKVTMKFSYHESGCVHMKQEDGTNKKYHEMSKWTISDEIIEPKRFFVLISKAISHYDIYNKKLTKGDSHAIILKLPAQKLDSRHYFEFFISPAGKYQFPKFLIKTTNTFIEKQPITQSLNKDFILVIRNFTLKNIDDWHPDKEIFFI